MNQETLIKDQHVNMYYVNCIVNSCTLYYRGSWGYSELLPLQGSICIGSKGNLLPHRGLFPIFWGYFTVFLYYSIDFRFSFVTFCNLCISGHHYSAFGVLWTSFLLLRFYLLVLFPGVHTPLFPSLLFINLWITLYSVTRSSLQYLWNCCQ
jgi:hypothetical protein